jgi:preprotein translocase subunit YajC
MMIAASSTGASFFLIIILVFAVLWLLVMRPQRRRQTQQQQMLRDLRVGDEVLTAGGIYGEIVRLGEDDVGVEIAPKTEVRVARRAIAAVVTEHEADESWAAEETEETESADGEKWRSAFDDEDSDQEKPG